MEIKVTYNHGANEFVLHHVTTVDTLYQEVGMLLVSELDRATLPSQITAESDNGLRKASWTVKQRGSYCEGGKVFPSLYVICDWDNFWNDMTLTHTTHYPHVFLTCIHADSNNYKFYEMEDSWRQIIAHYGRINEEEASLFGRRTTHFDRSMYWIRYYEKLSKGYVDQSAIYLGTEYQPTEETHSASDDSNRDDSKEAVALFDRLYQFAKEHVQKTVSQIRKSTAQQVKQAGELLTQLSQETEVESFNTVLKQLLVLIPRSVCGVRDLLAYRESDFPDIINRERNLYQAMKGVSDTTGAGDTFKNHNILVRKATEKQREKVLSRLEETERRQVKEIYRVIHREQKKRFTRYLEEHDISKVKELWHGSTNENWLSIMETSVNLNHACNGMFGRGLYFAPSSNKSQGYTSNYGSCWSHGTSSTYFMGLFATAFGKPLLVHNYGDFNEEDMKQNHTDCVYAKRENTGLRRDEVVFYNNDAVCLNYIVEFKNG